tara:strand:+ start:6706 stop:7119 length:414 start_codon:yes stop_codon:yes gene_type:complete
MSDLTGAPDLLIRAANELESYINAKNKELKRSITSTDLDEPDYHDHQTCHELYELAEKIKQNLTGNKTISEWISVNDRLPNICGLFLVIDQHLTGDKVTIGFFEGKPSCMWMPLVNRYNCDGMEITHWMPLPEPPEK